MLDDQNQNYLEPRMNHNLDHLVIRFLIGRHLRTLIGCYYDSQFEMVFLICSFRIDSLK